MLMDDPNYADFCRVCRCEATASRPLFYPCMCTGSIKYIHQDCLLQWLQYSKRRTCELCNHPFKFAPIYASDTPRFIPPRVLFSGLARNVRRIALTWLHYYIVFVAWLVVVPLTACRIYRCLFTGSVSALLTLPLDMISTRHLLQDCLQGFTIVLLALAAFLGYISLREQLLQGGIPAWLGVGIAADNGEDDGQPFFPDLFNFFGAANLGNEDEPAFQNNANAEPEPAHPLDTSTDSHPSTSEGNTSTTSDPSTSDASPPAPTESRWRSTGPDQAEPHPDPQQPAENQEDENDAGPGAAGIAEAMNWDRLLGLDGSFAFLEHILWLVALNTLFIVVFAFCPYHMGQFAVLGFKLDRLVLGTRMEGLVTGLLGYLIAGVVLVLLHYVFKFSDMPRASYWFGLGYIYVKVALLTLLEVGILPILCGFWVDACTLSLFNATVPVRLATFHYAPLTFTFIRWAVGMLYIFHMASFLILARGVVRPGLLRFVSHFNDPDYKPVQDMISQPLLIYSQRLVATFSIWGILIVVMMWVPVAVVRRLVPGFLPFRLSNSHESPFDYSVEIILVQVVLPFLLDTQTKTAVGQLLRVWCIAVGRLLGIRSYLLGDVPFKEGDIIVQEDGFSEPFVTPTPSEEDSHSRAIQPSEANNNHDDVPPLHPDDPDAVQQYVPYARPPLFPIRMLGFTALSLLSLFVASLLILVVPVGVGRLAFHVFSSKPSPRHDAVAIVTGVTVLSIGLRLCTYLPVFCTTMYKLASAAVNFISHRFTHCGPLRVLRIWTRCGATCEISIPRPALPAPRAASSSTESASVTTWISPLVRFTLNLVSLVLIAVLILVVLPVAIGLWVNLTFIIPVQVGSNKTLVIGFWEYWIFGIMHLKVTLLLTLAGPQWCFKQRMESVQNELTQHGLSARAVFILNQFAPLLAFTGLALSTPYLLAHYTSRWLGIPLQFAFRLAYPGVFAAACSTILVLFQLQQLTALYRRIKDENYLIGRRLINFMSPNPTEETQG